MRVRGLGRLRRLAKRLGSRPGPRAVILLYHRVAEPRTDPWSLSVSPRNFDAHLKVLRERCRPVPLGELHRDLLDGRTPEDRSVVVTFDDGYADNLLNAVPLLERHNVPATFFLSSGYLGEDREFWWDELDRLLLQPGTLPRTLVLDAGGQAYKWDLGAAARYESSEESGVRGPRSRSVSRTRRRLYDEVWKVLYPLDADRRAEVLGELLDWAGDTPSGRMSHRPLTLEETVELGRGGLFEVGAHTVSHVALPELPVDLQRDEVRGSKSRLEKVLDRPVTSFSYPYGNLSPETASVVREAGFERACSTVEQLVEGSDDPFLLPRVMVTDRDGESFSRWLSRWLGR